MSSLPHVTDIGRALGGQKAEEEYQRLDQLLGHRSATVEGMMRAGTPPDEHKKLTDELAALQASHKIINVLYHVLQHQK